MFSGLNMRVAAYLVFLLVGIGFVLMTVRRLGYDASAEFTFKRTPLAPRHSLNLLLLGAGVAFLVYASNRWHWKYPELSAYYLAMSMVFSVVAGIGASEAAGAFVDGMKKVLMAGVLIGLATAVEIILSTGQVLDTIVNNLSNLVSDHGPLVSAYGMFFAQLGLDVLIPSTSGQAAVTMPIFGPLGQLSGVSAQTTVYAFFAGQWSNKPDHSYLKWPTSAACDRSSRMGSMGAIHLAVVPGIRGHRHVPPLHCRSDRLLKSRAAYAALLL